MHSFSELFNPANYFFNPYAIPNIITGVYCFFLAAFVLIKRHRRGLSLFFTTFATGIYFIFFAIAYLASNPSLAFIWLKTAYALFGVPFIAVSTYYFSLEITGMIQIRRERLLLYFGYFIMAALTLLLIFTDLFYKFPPRKFFWGYFPNPGVIFHFFFPLWVAFAQKGTYNVYRAYKRENDPLEKNRLKIFLRVYLLGYIGSCDFLAVYGFNVYPFGYFPASIYLTLLVYNFIKYKALGIETVFHKTLLWLSSIFLIILPVGIATFLVSKFLVSALPSFLAIFIFSVILVSFAYYYFYLRPKIDYIFGKKEYAYYELLGRISAKVSTSLDVREFAGKLLDELDSCINPQKVYLYLLDEATQDCFLFARKFPSQETFVYAEKQEVVPKGEPIAQYLKDNNIVLEPSMASVDPRLHHLKKGAFFVFLQNENIEVLVPLTMEDKLIGILALGRKRSLRIYTKQDIEILNTLGKELGTSMYNALHHEDIVEKERLAEEMKLGREIQMNLLPREFPQISGLTVQGLMQPAKEIGGDYYDFITLPQKDHLAVVIGDVSGKGVAAGLLMAMAKTAIHTLSQEQSSPREILLRTNSILNQHIGGQKFMTLLYLMWQADTRTFTYSSAGHEHILLYRNQSQSLETIQSGGFMLGMIEDIDRFLEEKQISINPQDKILLYTDGVTEAENQDRDRFGLERLKETFVKHSSKPASELIQAIKDEVYAFIGTHPQYDDITLVVMEAT